MTTPIPLPNDPVPPMPIQPEGVSTSPSNPVLDEISAAHASLSPQAQQAIEGAHGMLGISPAHSDPALAASAAPSPKAPQSPFRSLGMVAGGPDQAGALLANSPNQSPEVAVPGVSGPRGPLPILSPEIPAPNRMETVGPGSMTGATPLLPGLREIGNTNLNDRPVLRNTDGSQSTESSISFGTDKGETLVPTVINGKRLSNADALNAYRQTGQHMGIFDTPENANNYAEGLERSRENEIASQRSGPSDPVAGGSSVGADEMGTHASPPMPITPPMTTAQSELQRRQETGSGVHQFAQNHKLLGIPLQIADAIGSGFFPRFAQFIPGTSAKHNLQDVPQAEREVADQAGQAKSAADVANTEATTGHTQAETANLPAAAELQKAEAQNYISEADARKNPALKPFGEPVIDPNDPTHTPRIGYYDEHKPGSITYGPEVGAKPSAQQRTSFEKMDDGTVLALSVDKDGKPTHSVVYKGDPKIETDLVKLKINGQEHSVIVSKKTGETIKDLGETGEKPPTVNVNAQSHQEQMKGKELLDKAEKEYRGAVQGANTLTDFVKSAQEGNKVTAQALPLEGALEITTTAGTKRINKTEVENYAGAGSLWDNIMGKLGKLKAGQPIPKDVQDDSIKLAKILQSNAYKTYKDAHTSAVKRYGLTDEEPIAEPGGGANIKARDPQGKLHEAPAGTALPSGWTLEK